MNMNTTEINMTLQEAIIARHSVRQYIEKPIEAEKVQQLQSLIDECNREGGLHMQLVTEEPNAFAGGMAKYGKFRGVRNYIAMICKKGDDVKLGYFGEKVILLAQTHGFCLVGCAVGPAFRFENFELAKKDELMKLYPQHGELIERMCKE